MTWAVSIDPRSLPRFHFVTGLPLLKQLYNTISGRWPANALRYSVCIQRKKECAEIIMGGQYPLAAAKLKQLLCLQNSLAGAIVLFSRGEE